MNDTQILISAIGFLALAIGSFFAIYRSDMKKAADKNTELMEKLNKALIDNALANHNVSTAVNNNTSALNEVKTILHSFVSNGK